jgi:hypothetical protein
MLVCHYPLNGNILDYSGNKIHPTNHGASIDYNGKIGKCYSFDGIDDYIDCGDIANFGQGDFSISLWIRKSTSIYNPNQTIIAKGVYAGIGQWSLFEYGGISSRWMFSTDKEGFDRYLIFDMDADEKWVHLIITRNNDIYSVYINGMKIIPVIDTISNSNVDFTSTAPLTIGSEGSVKNFNGKINDVRIYDHALSLKEIKDVYRTKLLHYTFDSPHEEPTENLIPPEKQVLSGWEPFMGAVVTVTKNITVPEWKTNNAERIQVATGGNIILKTVADIGLSVAGVTYCYSIKIKNIGQYEVVIDNNFGQRVYVLPGEIKDVSLIAVGDGSRSLTFGIMTRLAFYSLDFIAYQPQIEIKDHPTPFVNGRRDGVILDSSGFKNNYLVLSTISSPEITTNGKIGTGACKLKTGNVIKTGIFIEQVFGDDVYYERPLGLSVFGL